MIPENGIEQGEDWAEVISTHVATLLGVPCAPTRLCLRAGRRGSLSENIVPDGHSLYEGVAVMTTERGVTGYFAHLEGRPAKDPDRPRIKRPGHTLRNIDRALQGVHAPPDFPGPGEMTAFDVFAGYLVLDALIANRDRHEQNWAVLIPQIAPSAEKLAPSYDHASSVGFNLSDTKREACLQKQGALDRWARNGTAYRFEHGRKAATLVEHARNALALCTEAGAHWWRGRLATLDLGPLREALRARVVVGMSDPATMFADELLTTNLRRLRDVIDTTARSS